jgi:hypothetical protein
MEIILQSQALLTNTLTTARNETEITPQLLKLYNDSLEKLEVSIYPDIRRKFLKDSHNNLISIMKLEQKYFNTIEMIAANGVYDPEGSINNNPLSKDDIYSEDPKRVDLLTNSSESIGSSTIESKDNNNEEII